MLVRERKKSEQYLFPSRHIAQRTTAARVPALANIATDFDGFRENTALATYVGRYTCCTLPEAGDVCTLESLDISSVLGSDLSTRSMGTNGQRDQV